MKITFYKITVILSLILFSILSFTYCYSNDKPLLPFFILIAIILFAISTLSIPIMNIYRFLMPALVILVILTGFPIIYTIFISCTNIQNNSRLSKNDVKKLLLNTSISFNETQLKANFYIKNEDAIRINEDYNKISQKANISYDAVFDKNYPQEKENRLLNEIDKDIEYFIRKNLSDFSLSTVKITFQSPDNVLYIIDSDSLNNKNKTINLLKSNEQELNDYIEGYTEIEMKLSDFEQLTTDLNNFTFISEETHYYHELANTFIHKKPKYIANSDSILKYNPLTKNYDIKYYEDNQFGRYVLTNNEEPLKYYEIYEPIMPRLYNPFYQIIKTPYTNRTFHTYISESGFYDTFDEIFSAEYLTYLSKTPITKELTIEVKKKSKIINKQIEKLNNARYSKNGPAKRFKEKFYRNIVFLPKMDKIRFNKQLHSNISKNGILTPGYKVFTGLRHYKDFFANRNHKKYYLELFWWTTRWAFYSLLFSFITGLGFALILQKQMKFRSIYRTLLLLPYAIPSAISIMMWNIFLNTDFGSINNLIGYPIPWLSDPYLAKFTALLVNVWLSFPYFMVICLGGLQSIDPSLYEAADVDGASKLDKFSHITFPLLFKLTSPLLIGFFAYSFNNFTIIYLLYGRGTSIVISHIYNLSARQGLFAQASALSFITFILITPITYFQVKAAFMNKDT